jgi:hypothetical protein
VSRRHSREADPLGRSSECSSRAGEELRTDRGRQQVVAFVLGFSFQSLKVTFGIVGIAALTCGIVRPSPFLPDRGLELMMLMLLSR